MLNQHFTMIRQVATFDYMPSFPNLHDRLKGAKNGLIHHDTKRFEPIRNLLWHKDTLKFANAVTIGPTGRIRFRAQIAPKDHTEKAKQEIIEWVGKFDQALAQAGFE